jgi:hypothetical protein
MGPTFVVFQRVGSYPAHFAALTAVTAALSPLSIGTRNDALPALEQPVEAKSLAEPRTKAEVDQKGDGKNANAEAGQQHTWIHLGLEFGWIITRQAERF